MRVYKINDVIKCEYLKIPKTMIINEKYRVLSSDAKLTYSLLYDRLCLSKMNGWINEKEEVYLIYTREEIAEDLGITYKKAISAFKELIKAELIFEKRCGRGMPNIIYIVNPELSDEDANDFVKHENLRTSESAHLTEVLDEIKNCPNGISGDINEPVDIPDVHIKNFRIGISRTADMEVQDVPKQHTNKTNINKTDINHNEKSQSVLYKNNIDSHMMYDRRTDGIYSLDDILEICEIDTFCEEERKILYDALERMYYSEKFRIGDAVLPQEKVRSRMYEISATVLRNALDKLHSNDKEIKNITAYVMSTIFNSITEEYSLLHVDAYLNHLREKRRE